MFAGKELLETSCMIMQNDALLKVQQEDIGWLIGSHEICMEQSELNEGNVSVR